MTQLPRPPQPRAASFKSLLTEAAHSCLKPPPTGWLRRALLHLSYSTALARLLDTTCHTTVRTGPYTAVRDGYAALIDQSRKSEGFEVRIRKPHVRALVRARCQGPRPLLAVLRARRGETPS